MRDEFRGYYPPTDDEMKAIWDEGLIILDTNALLNLFRYSASAREDFFKALRENEASLWIPHQVGLEFHRRRIEVVNQQSKAFDDIEASLIKAKNAVDAALSGYQRHPSLDTTSMTETFTRSIEELTKELSKSREVHTSDVLERKTNETTFEAITLLYRGKVGPAFDRERLQAIYKEGESRYEKEIPPGYKDMNKPSPARYGDLVLWEQVLEHARQVKRPALFITDDQKEDWWYKVGSQTYGPRPELVDEYYSAAEARVHFLRPNGFLAYAQDRGSEISAESLHEVEQVSTSRRQASASDDDLRKMLTGRDFVRRQLARDNDTAAMNAYVHRASGARHQAAVERMRSLIDRIALADDALEDINRSLLADESAVPDVEHEFEAISRERARYRDELQDVLEYLDSFESQEHRREGIHRFRVQDDLRRRWTWSELDRKLEDGDALDDNSDDDQFRGP